MDKKEDQYCNFSYRITDKLNNQLQGLKAYCYCYNYKNQKHTITSPDSSCLTKSYILCMNTIHWKSKNSVYTLFQNTLRIC